MSDAKQQNIDPEKPDPSKQSPDVPSSTDKEDIENGLAESPELNKGKTLEERLLILNEQVAKTWGEIQKLGPDDHEKKAVLDQLYKKQIEKTKDLAKEITTHAKASGKGGGTKTLHFPAVDKMWDLLMKLLKMIFDMLKKGATLMRNMLPGKNPPKVGQEKGPAEQPQKEKTVIGMNLPGGGVAVSPPGAKGSEETTPEKTEAAVNEALEAISERQGAIKKEMVADLENANDDSGPAPGSAVKKPK